MAPKLTGHLLEKLRLQMSKKKFDEESLSAYIIPSGDAHQSEYIAPRHKRREFMTGFTGSAGVAIVTPTEALMWTDGRYFLQAEKELDGNWTLMKDGFGTTLRKEDWLSKKLPVGAIVGVDPNLISLDEWRRTSKELLNSGKSLVSVHENLVDLVWQEYDQPPDPISELLAISNEYSGKEWLEKVEFIREKMRLKNVYAVVVAALDEVAWLFNLRGSDIVYNPVFMSYAIVTMKDVRLFIEEERLTPSIRKHLKLDIDSDCQLNIFPYNAIQDELKQLAKEEKKIWISSKCSSALASHFDAKFLVTDISPVCTAKAVKNSVEIEGMKQAHIRDGAAVCEYLFWLEQSFHENIDEVDACEKLYNLRREKENFMSLSFATISSIGSNGAVIHYRPEKETAKKLCDDMYLCDSGGQYRDGTTDITRTIHLGVPTDHQKECFTRVLMGHIQLAQAVFPKATRGHVLDILARKALWDVGLDYLHGTGHGVGAFLNVHEGPIGISPRNSDDAPLEAGMFVSDEPGYYEDGAFGIRIENILLIVNKQLKHNFKDKGYLGFEPITMVPIQKKLLCPEMLSSNEIDWLNDYHEKVFSNVGDYLVRNGNYAVYDWLKKATLPLG